MSTVTIPVSYFETLSSTMDKAKELAEQESILNIHAVVSKYQTAGRGRQGSLWLQADKSLFSTTTTNDIFFKSLENCFVAHEEVLPVTFIFPFNRLKVPLEWVTTLMGCAVYDALTATVEYIKNSYYELSNCNMPLMYIKWPNDIVIFNTNEQEMLKICGILCESSIIKQKINTIFLGVGLNFFSKPELQTATSFFDALCADKKLIKKSLQKLSANSNYKKNILSFFAQKLSNEIVEYFCFERSQEQLQGLILERSLALGTSLSVNKGQQTGKFAGITTSGALILEGHKNPIYAGDVDFIPLADKKIQTNKSSELISTDIYSGATKEVLSSMLKARILVKQERVDVLDRNDFRRLGVRLENVNTDERLDGYLAKKFPFHSRELWRERIINAEVLLENNSSKQYENNKDPFLIAVKPTYRIKNYDQIWLYHPPEYEPDVINKINPIFDDGDLCIFSKPPNMVVHATGLYGKNTFVHAAAKMGYDSCAAVHRIDRETSGLLVCARTTQTRHLISKAFKDGLIEKMYLAVTKGSRALPDIFKVNLPIGEPEHSLIRLKLWVHGRNPQYAETYFYKLSSYEDTTLFACLPQTGRTNQIRIHLAALGHWIIGDKMYHENENVFIEFYEKGFTQWVHEHVLFPRHMLHNAGIMATNINYVSLSQAPIVCPLAEDMMESNFVLNLFHKAKIPLEAESQCVYLKDLFLKLHSIDFSTVEVISDVLS